MTFRFKVALLLIIFSLFLQRSSAQSLVDSLINNLENSKSKTELLSTRLLLARELVYVDTKQALHFALEVIEEATRINDKKSLADAYRILGSIYSVDENYVTSSEFIQRAMNVFRELNDSTGLANTYISFGHIYRRQGNINEELYYHRKSFDFFKNKGDKDRIGVTLHNYGESLYNAGKLDSAEIFTQKAIRINEELNRLSVLSSCYKVLGKIYFQKNKYDEAKLFFLKVIDISNQLGEQSQKIATLESLLYLASIYSTENNRVLEIQSLNEALNLIRIFPFPGLSDDVYHRLIEFYIQTNNKTKALFFLNESKLVNDSLIINQQLDRSELMKSALTAFKLEKENALQAQTLQLQNRFLLISLIFAIVLVTLIIGYIFINNRLRKSNNQLDLQKELLTEQKDDLTELNLIKDKFFGIIAHDLKGPIGTLNQLAILYFENKSMFSPTDLIDIENSFKNTISQTYDLTENLINWARLQMAKEPAEPQKVDISKLIYEINQLFYSLSDSKLIKLINEVPNGIIVYSDFNQTSFIIRNLISNAFKFTKMNGEIRIKLKDGQKEYCTIAFSDNGIGMSDSVKNRLFRLDANYISVGTAGEKGTGLGLLLCKEFAEANNGNITFESKEGFGTTFYLKLPVDNESHLA
jgi:signal transduction histidine kinase